MRIIRISWLVIPLLMAAQPALSQSTGQQSLAGTLGIYVFPAKGQDATQQSEDEAACYKWAVSNTGVDPFAVQKQQAADQQQTAAAQQQAATAGAGSGARGAVGGAAAGALIGEIAHDDAGKGAAWGAAVGLLAGRRKARLHQEYAHQEVAAQSQQAQQVTQSQMDGFKKAFSACMEGKNYIAKF
jgi:hypothetical protein